MEQYDIESGDILERKAVTIKDCLFYFLVVLLVFMLVIIGNDLLNSEFILEDTPYSVIWEQVAPYQVERM